MPHTCHTSGAFTVSGGHSRAKRPAHRRIRQPCSASFRVTDPSKPLISLRGRRSGSEIGGGCCPLTPSQFDRRGRFQAGCWEPAHGPFSVASSTRIRFLHSCPSLLRAAATFPDYPKEARGMLAKTQDNEEIIERVAAGDIGKAELVCCVPDWPRSGCRWTVSALAGPSCRAWSRAGGPAAPGPAGTPWRPWWRSGPSG